MAHSADARRNEQSFVREPLRGDPGGLDRSGNVRPDGQGDARTGADGQRGCNRASGLRLLSDSELPAGDELGSAC